MRSKNTPFAPRYFVLALIGFLLACKAFAPDPTPTPTSDPIITFPANVEVTPTLTASVFPVTETVSPVDFCEALTAVEVTLYQRPSFAAEIFSTLPSGFALELSGKTESGWVGFDPGVAQAANTGPFRLRWIEADKVILESACAGLPVVWAPAPGICFEMPMEDVAVHVDPVNTSPVVATLTVESYAAVVGITETGWAKVDLAPGNTGSSLQGWIEQTALNINGPCGDLPVLSE